MVFEFIFEFFKVFIVVVEFFFLFKFKFQFVFVFVFVKEESEDSNDFDLEDGYKFFCGFSKRKVKCVIWEQIYYIGNIGIVNGCLWNFNFQVVFIKVFKYYKYVQNYKNVGKVFYEVICFNKIGVDGGVIGFFKVEGQNQFVFKF